MRPRYLFMKSHKIEDKTEYSLIKYSEMKVMHRNLSNINITGRGEKIVQDINYTKHDDFIHISTNKKYLVSTLDLSTMKQKNKIELKTLDNYIVSCRSKDVDWFKMYDNKLYYIIKHITNRSNCNTILYEMTYDKKINTDININTQKKKKPQINEHRIKKIEILKNIKGRTIFECNNDEQILDFYIIKTDIIVIIGTSSNKKIIKQINKNDLTVTNIDTEYTETITVYNNFIVCENNQQYFNYAHNIYIYNLVTKYKLNYKRVNKINVNNYIFIIQNSTIIDIIDMLDDTNQQTHISYPIKWKDITYYYGNHQMCFYNNLNKLEYYALYGKYTSIIENIDQIPYMEIILHA